MAAYSWQLLRNEIDADPEARGWAGMTDAALHLDLTTKRYVGEVRVTIPGSVQLLQDAGNADPAGIARRLATSLKLAGTSDDLVEETRHFVRAGGSIDLGNAVTRAILDAFAADGTLPLTQSDADALKALADNKNNYLQKKGWPEVIPVAHVTGARALP